MKHCVALLALLLVACSQGQPAAKITATTSCRLPISITDASGNLQGAFVTYPGGKVTIDSSGPGGADYIAAQKRWLTVRRDAVSPDGSRYAYTERKVPGTAVQARLHVIEISTGQDSVFALGLASDTSAYTVIEFASEGIWLTYSGYESPRAGLFLFDLTSGALRDVGGPKVIYDPVPGARGVFWFTDGGPSPHQSQIGLGGVLLSRVQRLTVADGKTDVWFTEDGSDLSVIGSDLSGHPIITDGSQVWLALSPDNAKVIGLPKGYYQVLADSHGIWFGGGEGIYLYSPTGDLVKVSSQSAGLAGTCG